MNYLAHFHLSYGDDALLVGALLGDFVKGPLRGNLDRRLEQGIWLHRKIDAFTDNNEQLRQLRQRFRPEFHRYSGIMTDVIFDHFLNLHWQKFHGQPLAEFSSEIYQLLDNHHQLPPAAQQLATNLRRYDVLGNYAQWQTVESALPRIGQRLNRGRPGRGNPLQEAAAELRMHYEGLERGFLAFYPQLITHCKQLRSTLPNGD